LRIKEQETRLTLQEHDDDDDDDDDDESLRNCAVCALVLTLRTARLPFFYLPLAVTPATTRYSFSR